MMARETINSGLTLVSAAPLACARQDQVNYEHQNLWFGSKPAGIGGSR